MSHPDTPRPFAPLRTAALVPALALLAAGCSALVEKPDVRIARVGVRAVGLSGATAAVELEVDNPNSFDLSARSLRYTLDFEERDRVSDDDDWRRLAEGERVETVTLAGNETTRVVVDVPFRYEDLGRAALGILREGSLRYRFRGEVVVDGPVGDVRVPFDEVGLLTP